jgi:hypothetical protein
LPETWFAAEHPATALKEAAELGQFSSKTGRPAGRGGIAGNEWQQGCTRRMRFTSGVILRLEDRGVAGFRFRHFRTTAQRIGENQI